MRNASQTVNVLDLLTSQHGEVDQLFAQLEAGRGDKAAAFRELADKLAAHATVEEKIFYPAAMQAKTDDMLHESVEEHLAVKRLLADMLALDPEADAAEFDAKLSVLKENVSHHAHEEEEEKLFPILRKSMSADDLSGLGNEVLALFEQLMEGEPRNSVPAETDRAAALPAA
ncbi:MAG TPA: hemerythrin domain-containing protein [Kofleriaceae bacterium]